MPKNVLVMVKSTRIDQNNEIQLIETQSAGTLHEKNHNYYIIYKEPRESGMVNVTTTLKVEGQKITILRNGSINMRQEFEKDVMNRALYQSPLGIMEMTVKPWQIQVHLTDLGGSIKLEYELELDGAYVGKTSLDILVTSLNP